MGQHLCSRALVQELTIPETHSRASSVLFAICTGAKCCRRRKSIRYFFENSSICSCQNHAGILQPEINKIGRPLPA